MKKKGYVVVASLLWLVLLLVGTVGCGRWQDRHIKHYEEHGLYAGGKPIPLELKTIEESKLGESRRASYILKWVGTDDRVYTTELLASLVVFEYNNDLGAKVRFEFRMTGSPGPSLSSYAPHDQSLCPFHHTFLRAIVTGSESAIESVTK